MYFRQLRIESQQMTNQDLIIDIARFGLENDRENLQSTLIKFIEHNKSTGKVKFALQLKSLLKDNLQKQGSTPPNKLDSRPYYQHFQGRESDELILQKLNSDYRLENLVCTADAKEKLKSFLEEHRNLDILEKYQLPISNKLLLYGPSGCGKTLASYVIAGELDKTMIVVNLGQLYLQN